MKPVVGAFQANFCAIMGAFGIFFLVRKWPGSAFSLAFPSIHVPSMSVCLSICLSLCLSGPGYDSHDGCSLLPPPLICYPMTTAAAAASTTTAPATTAPTTTTPTTTAPTYYHGHDPPPFPYATLPSYHAIPMVNRSRWAH